VIRDNGRILGTMGGFQYGANSLSGQTTLENHYPAPVETMIGVLEPGSQHVISAEYQGTGLNTRTSACQSGSEIHELRIVVGIQG